MSAIPVSRFLADFRSAGPQPVEQRAQSPAMKAAQEAAALEARLAEAYARGCEQGRAGERAALSAELEQCRAKSANSIAVERAAWAEEQGKKLASRLEDELRALERRVADAAGRILRPFVAAAVQKRAIAELADHLVVLLGDALGTRVHIRAPADLLQAIRKALPAELQSATFVESDDCDIRVRAIDTVLETRLRNWKSMLEEAIA